MAYPWNVISIDREKLIVEMRRWAGTKYKLGAKAGLSTPPEAVAAIDCSGFVRHILYNSTPGRITMPDGSWHQEKWCGEHNFKPTEYANCALTDDRVRIGFIKPTKRSAGHVLLCVNAQTIESRGGHGPGRRRWNVKPLISKVSDCYVLSAPLG